MKKSRLLGNVGLTVVGVVQIAWITLGVRRLTEGVRLRDEAHTEVSNAYSRGDWREINPAKKKAEDLEIQIVRGGIAATSGGVLLLATLVVAWKWRRAA